MTTPAELAERLVADLRTSARKGAPAVAKSWRHVGSKDAVGVLAELAVLAEVDKLIGEQHKAVATEAREAGWTWEDIAKAVGLARGTSAETRYSGKASARTKAYNDRKAGKAETTRRPKLVD